MAPNLRTMVVALLSIGVLACLCSIASSASSEIDTLSIQKSDIAENQEADSALEAQSHKQAADLGLETLIQLKPGDSDHEAHAIFLGFKSVKELQRAEFGEPLRAYAVPLDKLKAFKGGPNLDPMNLLVDTRTIVYPLYIQANGQKAFRSSLTVISEDGKTWYRARTGSSKFITQVEKYRTSSSNFLVVVPALGQRFLADLSSGRLMLIPLDGRLGLIEGKMMPAHKIFAALAVAANNPYPQPPEGNQFKPSSVTPQ